MGRSVKGRGKEIKAGKGAQVVGRRGGQGMRGGGGERGGGGGGGGNKERGGKREREKKGKEVGRE